jgi:FkbH-like protein
MVLRLDDFSCFIANWDDKATNLARIARDLNIGLDSVVFFDDNPAERSIVRRLRPEVAVPEVPDDPSQFIRVLDQARYFELIVISTEDLKRTESYRADSQREELAASLGDLDEFLRSLEMQARIEPVNPANLERSAQLINRSNQFNLTTRRYTSADLLEISQKADWITRTVSLRDRFGDAGLISVLLARVEGQSLVLDTWLMSCRVLKRGVERLLLNHVVRVARERGLKLLVGEYIPTPKNGLVRDHYPTLGFTHADASTQEVSRWELRIDGSRNPLVHFIQETGSREPIDV